MFAVRPIYVQDSIFKMSSESPDSSIFFFSNFTTGRASQQKKTIYSALLYLAVTFNK